MMLKYKIRQGIPTCEPMGHPGRGIEHLLDLWLGKR